MEHAWQASTPASSGSASCSTASPRCWTSPDARPAPPLRGAIEFRDVSFAYQPLTEDAAGAGEPAGPAVPELPDRRRRGRWRSWGTAGRARARSPSCCRGCTTRTRARSSSTATTSGSSPSTSLRAQISMVLQETILLRGTVAENIAYGREGATPEDVVAAAQQAPARTTSSWPCPTATTPSWASGPRRCPAGSGSGWPSPARSSATPRSSSWTSRRPAWTPSPPRS